jgi:hypothetical protein
VSYVPVSLFQSARQGQLGQGFQCPCQRCKDERTVDHPRLGDHPYEETMMMKDLVND